MPLNLENTPDFVSRHIGPTDQDIEEMLRVVGSASLDEFIDSAIPHDIRTVHSFKLPAPMTEHDTLEALRQIARKNIMFRSLIGMGYSDTILPAVIQRNILENPGWYTQYTPYQAEIAQGRLEALLNFQTMVSDLTGFPIANASLLDEATAAAEVMTMFFNNKSRGEGRQFFVADDCHPQIVKVVETRARHLGIRVLVGNSGTFEFSAEVFGALISYPTTDGAVRDYTQFCERAHRSGSHVAAAADLMALTLITPPGEFGADAAIGNTQRFGVPLGYGGPHAAYLSTTEEFKRLMPGRIIGVSIDSRGERALRMALQTREQHIRREKATSNICTAQVLLAVMAGMYAVYHGPSGLKRIAEKIHNLALLLAQGLQSVGYSLRHKEFFDTIRIQSDQKRTEALLPLFTSNKINLRWYSDYSIGISLDELSSPEEIDKILSLFGSVAGKQAKSMSRAAAVPDGYHGVMKRASAYLTHPVFNSFHSETEMMRYIRSLEQKDLSLTQSMIPLGSCTMKLNASTELFPVSWREFNGIHPFVPVEQAEGYQELFRQLEKQLTELTGFAAISFQPNSGAQGEYTGLLVIRTFHENNNSANRDICLIPSSAHGTNPASAVMAGMHVVVVDSNDDGSINVNDLRNKAIQFRERLGALMITYPSTHGVFEETIKEICAIVHEHGGLVYMDGANLNAQVGLCRPAELGADVCHLNLHKTFCIPHGGGGPGMGPIGVTRQLQPYLPTNPVIPVGGPRSLGSVSAAPWGSPSIMVISWVYIMMMGIEGLTRATKIAILNANYMAKRLEKYYPTVYKGKNDRVAHEFILDLRQVKESVSIEVEDVAKRLMDYGFHAPTTSFPVHGTLMIEPTESESKVELDRYCDALISIRKEIAEIEDGKVSRDDNVLKNAPHTVDMVAGDQWARPYSREKAAFPLPWVKKRKFWPAVGRINNAYGDKNLVCSCPPLEEYAELTMDIK